MYKSMLGDLIRTINKYQIQKTSLKCGNLLFHKTYTILPWHSSIKSSQVNKIQLNEAFKGTDSKPQN